MPELGRAFATLFEEGSQDGRGLIDVIEALGGTLIDAFQGAAFEGKSFREVLKGIIDDILVISELPGPGGGGGSLFGDILGGIFGGLAGGIGGGIGGGGVAVPTNIGFGVFAKGAAFSSRIGELVAATQGGSAARRFARGGVLESPTLFRFAQGVGLAGEAGPEAILPLTRMSDGKLGVLAGAPPLSQAGPPPLLDMGGAGAGGATTVNITINAPGADREGLREVKAELREVRNDLVRVYRSIPEVSLRAWANHQRRGGFR